MNATNKVLINAFGVGDSGGVTVLEKLLDELSTNELYYYYIFCNKNKNINQLKQKYQKLANFTFEVVSSKGLLYRLYYENIVFRKLIKINHIDLIYNFSGSVQFFVKTPQVTKLHNLLFFSKKLDAIYKANSQLSLWVKQVFLKRLVFKFMLNQSKYIEIQSNHVKNNLSNFINIRKKLFFVKSDIDVSDNVFHLPRQYNFSKKIKFLYIVGPHFEYPHKNLVDFTNAMLRLNEKSVNFEINITLTSNQLNNSKVWNLSLNSKTNFLGYISDQEKMTELFCDNAILISTSIIETLGLHVIEGIKNGIITIVPDEEYANTVYGGNLFKYKLFNTNALSNTVMTIINGKGPYSDKILSAQDDLRQSEMSKFYSIQDVFDEVINVQG
jgi:glycosyltransferase involved in cell wall biosynthesis